MAANGQGKWISTTSTEVSIVRMESNTNLKTHQTSYHYSAAISKTALHHHMIASVFDDFTRHRLQ